MGTRNHWLGISLTGYKSNRSAFGARVIVTNLTGQKQIFDASTGGSYLSSNDPRIVVGLGNTGGVRSVEVRWPSGRVQTLANPPIDRYIRRTPRSYVCFPSLFLPTRKHDDAHGVHAETRGPAKFQIDPLGIERQHQKSSNGFEYTFREPVFRGT